MTYQQIKSFINTYIVQNGVNAITGSKLNTALNELADYKGFDSVVVTTLPAGSDATATVQGMTLVLGIPKGADGRDGQDAVNPFKGWFTTNNIPTTGQAGDYCNVSDTSVIPHTITIYRWNTTTNQFEDTSEVPDTATGETFASSETLQEVAIDDSHLVNPVNTADAMQPVLAKAADVMQLKAKLEGVTASEEKVQLVTSGEGQNVYDGYINGMTGVYTQSAFNNFIVVPLNGAKSVRWLGKENTSNSSYIGWAFGTFSGDIDSTLSTFIVLSSGVYANNQSNNQAVEYNEDATEGATHAVITIWKYQSGSSSVVNLNNFYCYLQKGESVCDLAAKLVAPTEELIDLNNEAQIPFVIGSSTNQWWAYTSDHPKKCALIKTNGGKLKVIASSRQAAHYAFLSSYPTPINGEVVSNFVAGTSLNIMNRGTTAIVDIPVGTKYIYIKIKDGLEIVPSYMPSAVSITPNKILDTTDVINGLDSNETRKALSAKQGAELSKITTAISDALNPFVDFPLANELFIFWRISSSGGNVFWHQSGTNCQCYLVDVKPGEKFYIEKNNAPGSSTTYCQWVFLAEKPNIDEITEGSTPNFANDTQNNQYININPTAPTSAEFEIPEGCTCLYISKSSNSNYPTGTAPTNIQYKPLLQDVVLIRPSNTFIKPSEQLRYSALGLRPINFQVTEDGWELPQTLQQLNVIKKSNQLRFLKWTPKHNIPADFDSNNILDTIPANVPFAYGIPYSSNLQDYKYVGIQVSIYTFLTAINNPYSLMYTECVSKKSEWRKSAWGRKWKNNNASSYYGLVCCGFSAAVTGCPTVYNNNNFPILADAGEEFVKVASKGVFIPELVQIGDIFDSDSHSYVVYSIQRDANGKFLKMRISECTRGIENGSGCQFREIEQPTNAYTHYRYMPLCNNWKFTEEETDFAEINQILPDDAQVTQPSQSYSNDICTFAGDKACFSVGAINDLIVLNYNLQNGELMYDRILLYKDNEQNPVVLMLSDAEDSLTGIYDAANSYNNINQIGHAYVVSNPRSGNDNDVLGAGKYRAVLSDAYGAESNPTYFEVLENPVSFIPSDSYIEVKFTNQITACAIGLIDSNGGDPMFSAKKVLHLSFSEIEHKTIKIDRKDLEAYPMENWYLRMLTIGEYGISQVIQKLVPEEVG